MLDVLFKKKAERGAQILKMKKSKLFDNITKMIIKNNFDKIEAKADTSLQKGTVDSSINFDDVFSELD